MFLRIDGGTNVLVGIDILTADQLYVNDEFLQLQVLDAYSKHETKMSATHHELQRR